MPEQKSLWKRGEFISLIALGLLIFVAAPLLLDVFRLNLVGKYLTYALSRSG